MDLPQFKSVHKKNRSNRPVVLASCTRIDINRLNRISVIVEAISIEFRFYEQFCATSIVD